MRMNNQHFCLLRGWLATAGIISYASDTGDEAVSLQANPTGLSLSGSF